MKQIKINGKAYEGNFNASNELSKSVEGLEDEVLIKYPREPREGTSPTVKIKIDSGVIKLGWHFFTEEEKKYYNEYKKGHSGTGGHRPSAGVSSEDLQKYSKKLMDVKGIPEDVLTFFKQFLVTPEQRKAIEAMKACGLSEEAAMKALGL